MPWIRETDSRHLRICVIIADVRTHISIQRAEPPRRLPRTSVVAGAFAKHSSNLRGSLGNSPSLAAWNCAEIALANFVNPHPETTWV